MSMVKIKVIPGGRIVGIQPEEKPVKPEPTKSESKK